MIPEVAEVSANYNVPYTPPIMEYRQQVVKTVVRVNDQVQSEIIYTYDKYGRLVESVVRSHDIGLSV
jgi:hypothetical protein